MVLLLVFMQLTRDLFAIAKFLLYFCISGNRIYKGINEIYHFTLKPRSHRGRRWGEQSAEKRAFLVKIKNAAIV